jgi:hypothetical protein
MEDDQKNGEARRDKKTHKPAYIKAFFRNAFIGKGGGFKERAGNVGSLKHYHNADLYPHKPDKAQRDTYEISPKSPLITG